ncbi:MAG TPA: hypothetical protein VHX65_04875 [Pirellulales bacterium]|jgi:hypothetical protein|nr:hypothetical protein [Pirellulales bacterium]
MSNPGASNPDAKIPGSATPGAEAERPLPEEIRHDDGRIEHPSVKRESKDVWPARIITILLCCVCVGGLDFFVVWHFFLHDESKEAAIKASTYPLAPAPSIALPSEPRLDPLNRMVGNEQANVFQTQLDDLAQLNQVGPAKEQGFVRIPIQEAMKLVVPRLPVRKQADPAAGKDNGLRYGGGPNSGRVFEETEK